MISNSSPDRSRTIVVVGNGMVGHRFCKRLVDHELHKCFRIVVFGEETRPAYNRVGLTQFFDHRDADQLAMTTLEWYQQHGIILHVGDRVKTIDRQNRQVTSEQGREIVYDFLTLATGSTPFVPSIDGIEMPGVFVYRTIEDLEAIIGWADGVCSAAVIGGGLLGLEAARAAHDLELETHVIEFAPRLMPRQLDDGGSALLVEQIEKLGIQLHLGVSTEKIMGEDSVSGMRFADGSELEVEMVIVSAGIRPRDELAKKSGLKIGTRGGVVVDNQLTSSDPRIFAIGEVASHNDMLYGLVAPGYEMADVVAARLAGDEKVEFRGGDLSAKLKLLGVDVASFGDHEIDANQGQALVMEDPCAGVYRKLLVDHEGKKLLGGILVGDASDYGRLRSICLEGAILDCPPGQLLAGPQTGVAGQSRSGDDQVCSWHKVSREVLIEVIQQKQVTSLGQLKSCTSAGSGCGGCLPMVTRILNTELSKSGRLVRKDLCEHVAYTRTELFQIIKIKQIRTFQQLLSECGSGDGCEICKPTVASILASLWNEHILEQETLQDTNDRFLANIQRGGLYSVIPRVPCGEITPEKLIVLGQVARKYNLYTKITGGQRIDLFGAQGYQLPDIWEELVAAGFESGHAYGKALRTVKSCVGSTWCRYGLHDSVGLAIQLEKRYRGIRAPHKIKGGVSGCVRECAEAQGKDFGLVATENGYNLYVCGNGGARPRHADLLAVDLDEETVVRYLDRFLVYYIQTADKLTRTATWLENMEGGIDYLREVVIDDHLGICEELERQMQYLVETYRCEWKEVVDNPELRSRFRQFVNSDENELGIEIITERGQQRPADWKKDRVMLPVLQEVTRGGKTIGQLQAEHLPDDVPTCWVDVGRVEDFPSNGGATVKYGEVQIAVFNFNSRGEWYACQNMCPHKRAFVLSQGIIGDLDGEPKVACPLHKRTFSLKDGRSLAGDTDPVHVFPVRVEEGRVMLKLPAEENLNAVLATRELCATACQSACGK